jgi:hypothetical protein
MGIWPIDMVSYIPVSKLEKTKSISRFDIYMHRKLLMHSSK